MIARLFTPLAAKILLSLVGALLITIGVQKCSIDRLTTQRDDARALAKAEAENHRQTKANYRAAQLAAAEALADNLARVQRERDAINERILDELENDRRAADARYRRLRAQARTGAESLAGRPDLSAIAEATCRTYAAASCDEIPALLKAAQDNTDDLLSWQDWGRQHGAVDVQPEKETAP
jgi:hypothetical protein